MTQAKAVSRRKATNLSLEPDLVAEARRLGVNLSRAAEDGIRRAVRDRGRAALAGGERARPCSRATPMSRSMACRWRSTACSEAGSETWAPAFWRGRAVRPDRDP